MSEKQGQIQSASGKTLPLLKGKLTLLNALTILLIFYAVCEVGQLFVAPVAPSLLPWIELGQWIIILLWLIVGVRPPFMRWIKQERARKE